MKRILMIFISLLFTGESRTPFINRHRQAEEDLTLKRKDALLPEKFYELYIKDKHETEINNLKDEWKKNKSWPVILFNHKILSVRDINEAFNSIIDNNKEQLSEVTLSAMIDTRNIYMRLYILKDDATGLKAGEIFKGYGLSYQLLIEKLYLTIKSYPVICE